MNTPRGNKWLLLISLVIGLSFGVHFMALLAFPAIGFLYFFKKHNNVTLKSFLIANLVIVAILLFIFKLLLPYTLAFFGKTEIFMVNSLGMPFNSGTIFAFILIVLAIVPTVMYVCTISYFGNPQGNIDLGSTLGSYFGLLFLIGAYTAIGIFTSTLSDNQIVAFILAVFCCFFFYFGFDGIATLLGNYSSLFAALGMDFHYKSMSRGVIDTRDIVYFVSVTFLFLSATVYQLKSLKW
jgi:hypothetical protein